MIQGSRVKALNDRPVDASRKYVLYWMQQSQRTQTNHALEYAIEQANELDKSVVVGFGLMDNYPEATERHYAFMVEGLCDVANALAQRGIAFVVRHGTPGDVALSLAKEAALVVCDRAYLRHLREWRTRVAREAKVRVVQVEADVVVPVDVASNKHETAARTLRPKIHCVWDEYLVPLKASKVKHRADVLKLKNDFDVTNVDATLKKLTFDRSVKRSPVFTGGQVAAQKRFEHFVEKRLANYAEGRNEPAAGQSSQMAPYLQYGQISPLDLALPVCDAKHIPGADRESFLEELIVRRELAHNYTEFNGRYDSFQGLPNWAQQSLHAHAKDKRPTLYSREQLETAQTADAYWNAAQMEMVLTGFMHNYMRMYWGKKVLEWTATPEEAFELLLRLNNRYFLCGLNSNSYGNVAWIFGQHDRPWGPERNIFGLVRYMNAAGLERKFDIRDYVVKIDDLSRELTGKGIRTSVLF
ncbi:MAG: deoxyribodipyrimidine photo-lyase [Tepidisphaeraceae bacterium]